jgi:hypothetical protein
MGFCGFWKNLNFRSKFISGSQWFYWKSSVWGKNWLKLRISWSWPPYWRSVIHIDLIYEFLRVSKKFKFLLKIHRCYPTVLSKITTLGWKLTETPYFLVVTHIRDWLYITVPYMRYYGCWKKSNFRSKFIGVLSYGFTEKHKFGAKTDPNSIFQGHKTNILDQLYITVPHMVLPKITSLWQKLIETPHFFVVSPILQICYT